MGMLICIHCNINAFVLTFWLNLSLINQLCSLMVETDGNRMSLGIFLKGNVENAANLLKTAQFCNRVGHCRHTLTFSLILN